MDAILGYTLGQFQAFGNAVARLENERLRGLMAVTRIAVNGDEKSYGKMLKALGG